MRIIAFSDTHERIVESIQMTNIEGESFDIAIHSGDITNYGDVDIMVSELEAFASIDATYKVFVPGNHDLCLDKKHDKGSQYGDVIKWITKKVPSVTTLICDYKTCKVRDNNVIIYGSPFVRKVGGWAFGLTDEDIRNSLRNMPQNTHILVSHSPARELLDYAHGEHLGSNAVLEKLTLSKTNLHVCGHIHEGRGYSVQNRSRPTTRYLSVNAACTHPRGHAPLPGTIINIDDAAVLNGLSPAWLNEVEVIQ